MSPVASKARMLNLEDGFPPELTSGRLALEFAQELATRKYDITVVTVLPRSYLVPHQIHNPKNKFFYWETMGSVKVLRIRPKFNSTSIVTKALEYLILPISLFLGGLLTRKKDILHCGSPPLFVAFASCLLGRITNIPVILRIQDVHPDALVKMGVLKNKLLIAIFEFVERFVYQYVDHITVIAEAYRNHVISKGINPNKVSLIPNWGGVKIPKETSKMNEFRRGNGFSDKFLITYAGTMSLPQDLETVVESANILQGFTNIQFLLVGEGVQKRTLEETSKRLKLKNVTFLPLQPREVYSQILQASDACLVSIKKSFESPTVPSKMLDIMASERAVLANVPLNGDVPHIIETSKCGLAVEPENPKMLSLAILSLYNDKALTEKLGRNGREYLEKRFSCAGCVDSYEDIINKLLKSKGK